MKPEPMPCKHLPLSIERLGAGLMAGAISLALISASLCNGASLTDFARCMSAQGQGSVCQLDSGTYVLNAPLMIGRSNLTIRGGNPNSAADTVLQRAPGYTGALLRDPYPGALTSISIRDLTFDGNRQQQTLPWQSFNAPDLSIYGTKSVLFL